MALLHLPESGCDPVLTLAAIEKARCERSLSYFIRAAWHVVEPGAEYFHNWHIDFIALHLEAIARGTRVDGELYNRLLINVPPGMMKSLLVSVFFPAWIWGPLNKPHTRIIGVSHSMDKVSIRDNNRMRRLVMSEWYQKHWGHVVILQEDQNAKTKFENTKMGFREATAPGSITGSRGDIVIVDDPLSVDDANSELVREGVNQWFLEALPTRLNRPKESAIVVIMQRLHEGDTSGLILEHGGTGLPGWDYVMLPMEYEYERTINADGSLRYTKLGYRDLRTEEGELLFPDRFPSSVIDRDKRTMGPYAWSGQFAQSPVPRGGGIIKDAWWTLWNEDTYPPLDYIVAAVDTAYTEKQENDRSAIVVFGVFSDYKAAILANTISTRDGKRQEIERVYAEGAPQVIMMYAWAGRLQFPDLCKKVLEIGRKQKIDRMLIEDKAAGISVVQELRRHMRPEEFAVQTIPAKGEKWSRVHSITHLFSEGMIWAPDKQWAEDVIRECSTFPKGKHDDYVDCVAHGLRYLRDGGFLTRAPERLYEVEESKKIWGKAANPAPLYPS